MPQPSGRAERFTDLPVDRYITVTEGKGVSPSGIMAAAEMR
jgi:hypothetical protein